MPPKLRASSVYVRIRPKADEGGHADETKVEKWLHGWTDTAVTLADARSKTDYTFPKRVLQPEVTQNEVYETMLPEFVEAFTAMGGHNVLFFAYGQTGTGKTHTMFGPEASLKDVAFRSNWGVFPRAVDSVLSIMNSRAASGEIEYMLLGSAVEFYLGECYDLLNNHEKCEVDSVERWPIGQAKVRIQTIEDLLKFLADVEEFRSTRSTRMNQASDAHGGSSRSHCALILTLLQVNKESKLFCETHFSLCDLAGAERPDKTKEQRMSGMEVLWDLMSGKEPATGSQAFVINYELFEIAGEVVKATDAHTKHRKYVVANMCVSKAVQFLGSFLDGSALLGMVVCLSQSDSCGWETWFSLQYGTDLSKLKAPAINRKPVKIDVAAKTAAEELAKAQDLLKKTPAKGSPASKYYNRRLVLVRQWEQQNLLLREMLQKV
mmetsp:Transcript_37507/g.68552  ORF Transcript_37507/g.68552 Transcript_37507/m.68552 type:complete len:435 (-) Transcript_37507:135-1439(-)